MIRFIFIVGLAAFISASGAEAVFPSPDRTWSSKDYKQAAQIISSNKNRLPKLYQPDGAKLFERIVSTNNLGLLWNKQISAKIRVGECLHLSAAVGEIIIAYANEEAENPKFEKEIARLSAFSLHVMANAIELVAEYKRVGIKDSSYGSRMELLNKGLSEVVSHYDGVAMVLDEPDKWHEDNLTTVLSAMAATLPRFKASFPETYIAELKQKLEMARPKLTRAEDVSAVEGMLKELQSRSGD
jgi:hypothetical protein